MSAVCCVVLVLFGSPFFVAYASVANSSCKCSRIRGQNVVFLFFPCYILIFSRCLFGKWRLNSDTTFAGEAELTQSAHREGQLCMGRPAAASPPFPCGARR